MYLFIHLCYITSLSADLKPRNKTFVFYIMPTHLLLAFMIIEHLVCFVFVSFPLRWGLSSIAAAISVACQNCQSRVMSLFLG